ncbi:MAG TPA: elongation factor G [Ideonella sp.]|uniref:elongation factor G n=1 Tax=Ideonella sp. TaxID=1929293 RepID=UPI002BFD7037|nr:elongation factor G [Ideonella sp.]HSI49957.1 elongation factor G [Ideonella sp.]
MSSPASPATAGLSARGAAARDAMHAIRSLALMGPAAAGKTLLAEALLHRAGMLGAPGSLERGSTVSDFDPLEKRLQHSLNSAVMHFAHEGTRVHLLDTPGTPDALGQSLPALEAVDTAAIVINAAAGLEPMALRLMAQAAERGRDRILIVNKIDAPGVDLPGVLAQLQAAFGRECLPLNLPSAGAARVVDCFFQRQGSADFSSVADAHRALVEQVVEVDAAFVERYLNEGDLDASELHAPLEEALRQGHLIPVCFVSARTGAGVKELLDVIVRLLPDPTESNPPAFLRGEGEEAQPVQATADPALPVLAHVFKVLQDPYVGKLGVLRVHQGTLKRDMQLLIGDARKPFKVGHLFRLQGKEHLPIDEAVPGDIAAIAKVDALHFDAVLHDSPDDGRMHLAPLSFPTPVHGLAISPQRHGDEQRLWELLQKLVDEDPCLRLEHVAATHETVVFGLGELHLKVLLDRLHEQHHCEVQTRLPKVAYRETITGQAVGQYRHKKQSGGAGQFGEVHLRVAPLARGEGQRFVDEVKGGAIPGSFMPAVEKGVHEALAAGVVAGFPVVDLQVTVFDGKHHSVDSKDIAFTTAARKATWLALQEARPLLLEPIVSLALQLPTGSLGDLTGDLASRRGQVTGTDQLAGGWSEVRALAPAAELQGYQSRLNALTGGQGRYTLALSHHEAAPPNVQLQMAKEWQRHDEG